MSFGNDLSKFTKRVEDASDRVLRGAALSILSSIVKKTPVGNPSIWKTKYPPKGYAGGRLRGNWQVNLNSPAVRRSGTKDKSGSTTISRGNGKIAKASIRTIIYIMNNLPYAEAIEYGHSTQAPEGMVRATILDWQWAVMKAAREAKAKTGIV